MESFVLPEDSKEDSFDLEFNALGSDLLVTESFEYMMKKQNAVGFNVHWRTWSVGPCL